MKFVKRQGWVNVGETNRTRWQMLSSWPLLLLFCAAHLDFFGWKGIGISPSNWAGSEILPSRHYIFVSFLVVARVHCSGLVVGFAPLDLWPLFPVCWVPESGSAGSPGVVFHASGCKTFVGSATVVGWLCFMLLAAKLLLEVLRL